jgi:catalase
MRSPNTNWDFWTSLPEALLQVTIIMGDRGLPSSYRHMHGFSSHAYSLINKDNKRVWVNSIQVTAGHKKPHRPGS